MAKADPLAKYNAKRDFSRTAEPEGKVGKGAGNLFIVQKHHATRLHWDLRLEVDGVLKSWAVTKGPSADPEVKRVAVRTEDHPMAYAEFEGLIPDGEYGGGSVMLWDKGTWAPVPGKSAKDIDKGHLHFTLQGERMKGEWLLIRLKPRPGEKRENWLLRKLDDHYVEAGDSLVANGLTSVLTGRTMAQIAGDKKGSQSLAGAKGEAFEEKMRAAAEHNRKVSRRKPKAISNKSLKPPAFVEPQLATLVDDVPPGTNWMHEIKFDGYRALLACSGSDVRVYTRNGHDWTDKFEPLVASLSALDLPASLIDSEIIAFGPDGNPDFSSLQAVLKRGHGRQTDKTPLSLFAFDLLSLEGEDLRHLTNVERKERLEALLDAAQPPIHLAEHVFSAGEKLFQAMCGAGQEGIISKRADAPYRSGRTKSWLKIKCTARQEFVIVGWTRSNAAGRPFSSLLLAQHEEGELVYKGKVGTGFNEDSMRDLARRMERLETDAAPLKVPKVDARRVQWVKPELVAEVAFTEFTSENRARHPSFLGLREDKEAAQVVPEKPMPVPVPASSITISSRDRVVFESGETKGNVADYYVGVAPLMLPFAAERPLSLVRCPQGRSRKCFFQKHDSGSFGPHVKQVPITEKEGGTEDYIYIADADGILACVQMNALEFHIWGSRVEDVELPDRMVFDLDPDEELDFARVKSAARYLHDRLADIGLVSFAMLSGGKGVHVIVPLSTGHDWDRHKDFSHRFAEALSTAQPERFLANMSKAKRKGRIFIDYLRNQRGSTAIAPYSVRARPGAPVAAPVSWDELEDMESAHPWSIADLPLLLERASGRALRGWGFAVQRLPDI